MFFCRDLAMRTVLAIILVACISFAARADDLTERQKIGMFLHGTWSWSIDQCAGIARNKRYWRFLMENGDFRSFRQISENVEGQHFKEGWNFMQRKADLWGNDEACDFAMDKWPAMLWRKK